MKIVGIIGPYFSGGNRRLIDCNIAAAQFVAIEIANCFAESQLVGFFAPHAHTARFEKLAQAPENYYHALDDTIYDRACDGFVLLPNWESSKGARRDYNNAVAAKKILFTLTDYNDFYINTLMQQLEHWALKKDKS